MRLVVIARLLALLLLLLPPTPTQEPVVVNDAVSCDGCSISVRRVHSFDVPQGLCSPIFLTWTGNHYALAPGCDPAEVTLASATGETEATLGARGQGPGERDRVFGLASNGQGRLLVHAGNRFQMYAGDALVSEAPLAFVNIPRDLALLPRGGFIVATTSSSSDRAAMTLHLFDDDGVPIDSFAPESTWRADQDQLAWRTIWPSPDGSLWSAKQFGRYEVSQWSTEGNLLRFFRRDPSPFSEFSWDTDERPRMRAIREHAGLVWTLTLVRSPPAELEQLPEPETGSVPAARARARAPRNALHLRNDTIIEVVDPEAGELLATRRVTDAMLGFLPTGEVRVWTYREHDDEDIESIEVMELAIAADQIRTTQAPVERATREKG